MNTIFRFLLVTLIYSFLVLNLYNFETVLVLMLLIWSLRGTLCVCVCVCVCIRHKRIYEYIMFMDQVIEIHVCTMVVYEHPFPIAN